MTLSKNKKGQYTALIAYGLISLFVIITFIIVALVMQKINTSFQDLDTLSDASKNQLNNTTTRLPGIFDAAYVLVIVLSSVVLVASVFFIDTHPLFAILTLPVFLITILGNAVFANAINAFGNQDAISSTYAQFPMTQFIASNWVTIVVATGLFSLVAFAAAKRGGGA